MSSRAPSISTESTVTYRPEIDGLRTLAVVSVILFHISDRLVPGGFAGVDIFFTISGYLITRIIAAEMEARRFSAKGFYLRRIRRILPAFMVVLATTIVVGVVLLAPHDLSNLLTSARHAVIFNANGYFARTRSYFDLDSGEEPLLHIWSLSVEEQFYFVWPLMLAALLWLGRASGKQGRMHVLIGTTIMLVVGFAASEYLVRTGSRYAYYSLSSRAGELLVGAWVALCPFAAPKRIRNWLAMAGLTGVLATLFLIDGRMPFPGVLALAPTISAALVLYAGRSHDETPGFAARLLGHPVMVHIGLLSYSLYLWHWPILAFMRNTYGRHALPVTWSIGALVLTYGLSMLSYRFVELPVKSKKMSFSRAFAGFYAAPLVLLLAVTVPINKYATADTDLLSFGTNLCYDNLSSQCVHGAAGVPPRVLMFGDSHVAALTGFVDIVGKHEGWSATMVSSSWCPPGLLFDAKPVGGQKRPQCDALKRFVRENYKKYDAIMIASRWMLQLDMNAVPLDAASSGGEGNTIVSMRILNKKNAEGQDGDYLVKLANTIRVLAKDRPVYVLADGPLLPDNPMQIAAFRRIGLDLASQDSGETSKLSEETNAAVKKVVDDIPNAHWLDLSQAYEAFDSQGFFNNVPGFYDSNHLNVYGSRSLGEVVVGEGRRIIPESLPKG